MWPGMVSVCVFLSVCLLTSVRTLRVGVYNYLYCAPVCVFVCECVCIRVC